MAASDSLRTHVLGPQRLLLVEGAAGCGKTYELAGSAADLACQVEEWQQVLLLTHTNAAREIFRQRLPEGSAKVNFQTLDSFACEIVSAYARFLGVPHPLRPAATGHPQFEEIRRLALRLLSEAPAVAQAIAVRYPVILVDEHQDSSRTQHDLVTAIAAQPGVRLRMFGDRLQSIYEFGPDEPVGWEALVSTHGSATLETPRRWPRAPALGEWLVEARRALLGGRQVSLRDRPEQVLVHEWAGEAPGPAQQGFAPACIAYLNRLTQCAVLVRNRAHAVGLATRVRRMPLYEGADVHVAAGFLEDAENAAGDPRALVIALMNVMGACGSGMPASARKQVETACRETHVEFGKKVNVRPLLELCETIYEQPTMHEWLAVLRRCFEQREALGWRPYRFDPLLLLVDRRLRDAESPIDALAPLARRRSEGTWRPSRFVATIHKVKGREFAEVAIPYCSSGSFPDTTEGRRLLYVAMSRATERLHLLVPRGDGTPLLAA